MSSEVKKVLKVAKAEVGYLEKKNGNQSYLYNKKKNAGSNNYTKYGFEMRKIYPSVMDYPAPWCDCFVDWCFYKAYGISTAKSLLGGNFDDYTVASCQMYKNKNALGTTPKVGAQVFFTKNGQVSGCYHTGLVYKVDKTRFYTIEGNTSSAEEVVANGGAVAKKSYLISAYKNRVLFGYPKYETKKATKDVTINKETKSKGVVTISKLKVRLWVGKTSKECSFSPIPKGAVVHICDELKAKNGSLWYYIKYDEKYGFANAKYIKKV